MKRIALVVLGFILGLTAIEVAWAHSGSPASSTWAPGQTLTSTALNDTIAHLHNTLSGAITNVNISSTAAVAHTKLATPALVPKAWGYVYSSPACVGSGTQDSVTCALLEDSGVTAVKNQGVVGEYRVFLDTVPTNANFSVLVTAHDDNMVCIARSQASGSASVPQFVVICEVAFSGSAADVNFSFLVMDT